MEEVFVVSPRTESTRTTWELADLDLSQSQRASCHSARAHQRITYSTCQTMIQFEFSRGASPFGHLALGCGLLKLIFLTAPFRRFVGVSRRWLYAFCPNIRYICTELACGFSDFELVKRFYIKYILPKPILSNHLALNGRHCSRRWRQPEPSRRQRSSAQLGRL